MDTFLTCGVLDVDFDNVILYLIQPDGMSASQGGEGSSTILETGHVDQ